MHFAKSLAIREKPNVILCAVTDFNSIPAETIALQRQVNKNSKWIHLQKQ